MYEPFLEPVLRRFRLNRVLPHIASEDRILDVGCGWNATTLRALAPLAKELKGIDQKVEDVTLPPNVSIMRGSFFGNWEFEDNYFDVVLMLAVLEHLYEDQAEQVLENIRRVIKPGGKLILTIPTPPSKPVLEFLSFKVGILNPDEIGDHKIYYDLGLLTRRLIENGFEVVKYNTFQMGMNSFCIARKKERSA